MEGVTLDLGRRPVQLHVRCSGITKDAPPSRAASNVTRRRRPRRSRAEGPRLPLRRSHPDALVSDPRPILHRGGLINPPHGSADTDAANCSGPSHANATTKTRRPAGDASPSATTHERVSILLR
jgi:hypothetical protein